MVYLLTTDDTLGSAGLKDMTKGVGSVLADFCSCRVEELRSVELSERDSHLFVVRILR